MQTISPGPWSNPFTWEGGKLPSATDHVEIMHDVNLDTDTKVAGITIMDGCELCIDPDNNVTVESTGNIIVMGRFCAEAKPQYVYTIRFTGIDENNFVGGGMDILDSDIGLWVMGAGELDFQGVPKTAWTNETGEVKSGDIALQIKSAIGWEPSDEIVVLPTAKGATNYDERKISNIVNATGIMVDKALTSHPVINNQWTAEVANLSRNIRIEGTPTGRAHIFIMSSVSQNLQYVGLRYMGPRKDINGDGIKELVTGRYALHFHHCGDGSRGSSVVGCVARDCDNHCFVPHSSHGIAMLGNVVYNVTETAFWCDYGQHTNDTLWENNLVALVKYVQQAQDQDSDMAPTFGAGGFVLGSGDGNICRGNVVCGTSGLDREAGAYIWPELRDDADPTAQLESPWTFENNTAHSCAAGISVWQNNNHHHIVRNTVIYNCDLAIFHGAYQNHYRYIGGAVYGGYIELRAASATTNRIRFEEMTIDAAGGDYCVIANEGPLAGVAPILFRGCKFAGFGKKAIIDQNPGPGLKLIDVVDCGLTPSQMQVSKAALSGEVIRLQQGSQAWKVTKSGTSSIALFAAQQWGSGTGLRAQYFTPDFKWLLLSRIEPNVNIFDITHPQIHYLVPSSFAARWSGKIQPQFSQAYTFYCNAGGGVRLWIDGKLLIDQWSERYPGTIRSSAINLQAGQLYDFKLEYFNQDDRSECTLEWSSGSIKREFVPMSQLYSN